MDHQPRPLPLTDRERFVLLGFLLTPGAVILANRIERAKMADVFRVLDLETLEGQLGTEPIPAIAFDHATPKYWAIRPPLALWLAAKLDRSMPVAAARVLDPVIERLELVARLEGPPLSVVPAAAEPASAPEAPAEGTEARPAS